MLSGRDITSKAGWELFKQNGLGFIGFSVVVLFVMLALGTKAGVGRVRISYIIGPPLWAGFIIVAIKLLLQQPTEVNDFTKGFKFILPLLLLQCGVDESLSVSALRCSSCREFIFSSATFFPPG